MQRFAADLRSSEESHSETLRPEESSKPDGKTSTAQIHTSVGNTDTTHLNDSSTRRSREPGHSRKRQLVDTSPAPDDSDLNDPSTHPPLDTKRPRKRKLVDTSPAAVDSELNDPTARPSRDTRRSRSSKRLTPAQLLARIAPTSSLPPALLSTRSAQGSGT